MRMQRVRGAMWPVSCGSAETDTLMLSSEAVARVHAQGMRTHCTDQRDLDGTAPEVVPGVLPRHGVGRSGRAFGAPSACGCREPRPPSSGDHTVLVDEAAQTIGSPYSGDVDVVDRRRGRIERGRRTLAERGARTGVLMILVPSAAKTASKEAVTLASRSRMRNVTAFAWSTSSMERLGPAGSRTRPPGWPWCRRRGRDVCRDG